MPSTQLGPIFESRFVCFRRWARRNRTRLYRTAPASSSRHFSVFIFGGFWMSKYPMVRGTAPMFPRATYVTGCFSRKRPHSDGDRVPRDRDDQGVDRERHPVHGAAGRRARRIWPRPHLQPLGKTTTGMGGNHNNQICHSVIIVFLSVAPLFLQCDRLRNKQDGNKRVVRRGPPRCCRGRCSCRLLPRMLCAGLLPVVSSCSLQ